MNPTDIFEALEAIAKAPFDPAEFGFSFADATDNAHTTVSKQRGGSLNHLSALGTAEIVRGACTHWDKGRSRLERG